MAGYKRARRTYIMEFTDPEYEGLEITVRSIPIRNLQHLMSLDPESTDLKVRSESIDQMTRAFAEALVSWNMTDENGEPLPTTLEYIESEDVDFIMSCIAQWMNAISRVDDSSPLDESSEPGQTAQGVAPGQPS
jgi:hypothetical protein